MEELITEAPKKDFFIRLNSEADLPSVFSAFYKQDYVTVTDEETGETSEVPDGDPYLVKNSFEYSIDIVGTIFEPTGNSLTDSEGNVYPETVPVDGWHVNFRLVSESRREDIEAIDSVYGVTPNSPSRVFL